MKKKRIAIYAALILVFAIACMAHIIPGLRARAYDYAAAEIGTATLADEGDTVFIRMAKFTFGEGDDAEEINAPGFAVANAAAGENPAEGIDLTVLTPITPEAPLTGTLDKNVYVCGGYETDLYLGDLTLAEGRKIYTDGAGLNFLGGKLTAPAIETAGSIAVGSADVTVNSDLTGFQGILLFVSRTGYPGYKGYDTPASLTVNGSVRNTGSYQSAAIAVNYGGTMTVTGDVYTEYPVVIVSDADHARSAFNVGGSLTVKNSPWWGLQLVYADAVIGGDVKVDNYVNLNNDSALQAKSVTAYLLSATGNSTFTVEEDVTLSNFLDCNCSSGAQAYSVGGKLKCGVFSVVGPGASNKCSLYVGGDIEAGQFYMKNAVLDADGDVKKTQEHGGAFCFDTCEVDVAENVYGSNFDLYCCDVTVHGDLTAPGARYGNYAWQIDFTPIRNSKLTVEGNAAAFQLNPMNQSDVTINGTLTQDGLLTLETGATLTLKSDFSTTTDVGINSGSHFIAEKDLTTNNALFSLNNGSDLTVGGDMKTNRDFGINQASIVSVGGNLTTNNALFSVVQSSNVTVTGAMTTNAPMGLDGGKLTANSFTNNSYIALNSGSEITVENDFTANDQVGVNSASSFTVEGNMISNTSLVNVRDSSTLLVKKDFTISERGNGFDSQGSGTVVTVNGNFNNNGGNLCNAIDSGVLNVLGDVTGNGWIGVVNGGNLNVTGDFTQSHGFWPTKNAVVNIGGNAECGENMEATDGSSVTIGGDVHAQFIGSISGSPYQAPSTVKIGGSAVCDKFFNVHEGSTMEIDGDFTYNEARDRLEGTLTVGGDFTNKATRDSVFKDDGLLVTGQLNVGGDVNLNNLILNDNGEADNLNVAGRINAYRKADVIRTVDGAYVIEDRNVTEANPNATSYFYTVPYNQQTAAFTIDGETYAIDVRSHDRQSYAPIKVSAANAVVYELNGGAFKAEAVIEDSYYTEIGLDLPTENDVEKRVGFLYGGWYDNADFEGDAITQIPAETVGDVTVYLKWIECDHAASTAQSTCSENAICTVCGGEIPTLPHSFTNYVPNGNVTCTVDGTKTAKCDNCDATDTIADPAPGHSFTNYVPDNNVTCTTDGTKTAKCDNCDATDTVFDVAATGHTYGAPVWSWIGTKATAYFTCEKGDDTLDVTASVKREVLRNATKMNNGLARYTATVVLGEETYTDSIEQEFPYVEIQHTPCPICGSLHNGNIVDNFIGLFHHMIDIFSRILI